MVRVGTDLTYRCDDGYAIKSRDEDELTITCQRSKQFTPNIPDCERMLNC